MGETLISWCDYTFNVVWGCQKVSEGCANCYAEALDARYHAADPHWGPDAPRRVMSNTYWHQPLAWNRKAERAGARARVFCSSMADVFEDHPTVNAQRERLWYLIASTPWLDWLLLTKRPQNIMRMLPRRSYASRFPWGFAGGTGWPNVWLGTTCENQARANERLPHLLLHRAAVTFCSYEPALGPVDFHRIAVKQLGTPWHASALEQQRDSNMYEFHQHLDWVIAGAESGRGAREAETAWFRAVRDQCAEVGTPFFLKQAVSSGGPAAPITLGKGSRGKHARKDHGTLIELPYLDGIQHAAWPRDRQGEDMHQ